MDWDQASGLASQAFLEGRYNESEERLKVAVEEAEKFGPSDARLAETLSKLVAIYTTQGKYAEPEEMEERAKAMRAKGGQEPR